jgi:RNA polymerase sigma factor (sigma-70 family)
MMTAMSSDLDLLQGYDRARDPEALNQLVLRHAAMVYAAAFRVTRNAADADDVTQECFLELARQAARVRTSVAGWLHLTATHRARDLQRRSSARTRAAQEAEQPRPDLDQGAWREISPLLDQALSELPDELRLPLIGHYLEGRAQGELAQELGVSRPTINRRISEGLDQLRRTLKQRGAGDSAEMGIMLASYGCMPLPAALKLSLAKIGLAGLGGSLAKGTFIASGHAAAATAQAPTVLIPVLALTIAGAGLGGWLTLHRSAGQPPAQQVLTATSAATAPAASAVRPVAPVGQWEQVTPAGITLAARLPGIGDSYGVQDVLADPRHPGTFFAFACYQGCWKSTDWGTSWSHVSADGHLEQGRPWSEAIAPDGSYLLACTGGWRHAGGGVWRSVDDGRSWTTVPLAGDDEDAYSLDIDAHDRGHAIAAVGLGNRVFESHDGGRSWAERTPSGAGRGGYLFFITSTVWLAVGQEGEGRGTRRTTDSGASWTKVADLDHLTGQEQLYLDPERHDIYLPTRSGIHRSSDNGATFQRVSTTGASTVCATQERLYAEFSWATTAALKPRVQSAPRNDGREWAALDSPSGLVNGAKRAAAVRDPASGRWVILSGCWNAGLWRYREP